MTDPSLFNQLFVWPITNVLIICYTIFSNIHLPGAFGWAIIALTVLIRLILHPLTASQLKSTHKIGKLKPQLDALTKKYKSDKTMLHQEQMRLYKEAGVNPAAGCLPLLLQMPILIALYNVFFQLLGSSDIGKIVSDINTILYNKQFALTTLNLQFFGLSLTNKPSEWQVVGWGLLSIPVITAVLQYIQSKLMLPAASIEPPDATKQTQEEKKEEKKHAEEDMSAAMQKQMSIMMPLMIGFFSYSLPVGLSLYWNTFTVFGIMQQYLVQKGQNTHGKSS